MLRSAVKLEGGYHLRLAALPKVYLLVLIVVILKPD